MPKRHKSHFQSATFLVLVIAFFTAFYCVSATRLSPGNKEVQSTPEPHEKQIDLSTNTHNLDGLTAELFRYHNITQAEILDELSRGHLELKLHDSGQYNECLQRSRALLQALEAIGFSELPRKLDRISVVGGKHDMPLDILRRLHGLLHSMPKLAELHWKAVRPPPKILLDMVGERHPIYKLFFYFPSGWPDRFPRSTDPVNHAHQLNDITKPLAQLFRSLDGNKNLYAIQGHFIYDHDERPNDLPTVKKILENCPNVKVLDLSFEYAGCLVAANQPLAFSFPATSKNITFPAIEVLRLNGYSLDGVHETDAAIETLCQHLPEEWRSLLERILERLGVMLNRVIDVASNLLQVETHTKAMNLDLSRLCPEPVRNIDPWLQIMNWSQIHTLSIQDPDASSLRKLALRLQGLDHVSLELGQYPTRDFSEAMESFISEIPHQLQSIKLRNTQSSASADTLLQRVVAKHGQTLQSFSLTELEGIRNCEQEYGEGPTKDGCDNEHLFLNTSHIRLLSEACPRLETLELDMPHPEAFAPLYSNRSKISLGPRKDNLENDDHQILLNQTLVSAIASIPRLRKLNLRFPSPKTFIRRGNPHNDTILALAAFIDKHAIRFPLTSPHFDMYSHVKTMPMDPIIDPQEIVKLFQAIRKLQAAHSASWPDHEGNRASITNLDALQTSLGQRSPVLQELNVYVGNWEHRNDYGMFQPLKNLFGHWKVSYSNISKTGVCEGHAQWPSCYHYGFERDGSVISEDRLEFRG